MKTGSALLAMLATLLCAAEATAGDPETVHSSTVRKVDYIYVADARSSDIFYEISPRQVRLGKELWADLRLVQPLTDDISVIAALPEGMLLERGDFVETHAADLDSVGLAGVERDRVVRLVARHNTPEAMRYENTGSMTAEFAADQSGSRKVSFSTQDCESCW